MSVVTPNASAREGSPVTCDGCEHEARWGTDGCNRKQAIRGPHCTTCHSDDHRACELCGTCLPDGHRYDRRYCSPSCRVRAHEQREAAALERAIWEEEHPQEAAREQAEQAERLREMEAQLSALDPGSQRRDRAQRIAELKANADRCAVCDEPFAPGAVIYRRAEHPPAGPVLPYCTEHRCAQFDGRHNADAPGGRYYPACRCPGDYGDRKWNRPEPCANCGRLVSNDRETADPRRFVAQAMTEAEAERELQYAQQQYGADTELWPVRIVRTFCSDGCRSSSNRTRAKTNRGHPERRCDLCREPFCPSRSDARYCSPACRQRAHRLRSAEA